MGDQDARIVSKDLMVSLKSHLCCSDSGSLCIEDKFCSSNPALWQTQGNGTQVKIAYPSDRNTIPGIPEFCLAYTNWYVKADCGPLAKDIQDILKTSPQCKTLSEQEKDLCQSIQTLIQERCKGMNGKDLQGINTKCEQVVEIIRRTSGWPKWAAGGTGVVAVLGYAVRVIMNIRKIGTFATALTKTNEEIKNVLVGIRTFFGSTMIDIGKTIRYVWRSFTKKGREQNKAEEEALKASLKKAGADQAVVRPDEGPVAPTRHETTSPYIVPVEDHVDLYGEPNPKSVFRQLIELSLDSHYTREGHNFRELVKDSNVRLYIVARAINRWDQWNVKHPDRIRNYTDQDPERLTGYLPKGYVRDFFEIYFKDDMVDRIREVATNWANDTRKTIADNITEGLDSEEVQRQLLYERSFNGDIELVQYLARLAIDEWNHLDPVSKIKFINDIESELPAGQLPSMYTRTFTKQVNLEEARRLAPIYSQVVGIEPELAVHDFEIVNTRLKQLYEAWNMLSQGVRDVFGEMDGSGHFPPPFIQYMRASLRVGTDPRMKIEPSQKPWHYNEGAAPIIYKKGIDLNPIMAKLVGRNPSLTYYPELLESRAKALVDDWIGIPEYLREQFRTKGEGEYIPEAYIMAWRGIASGVSASDRPAVKPPPRRGPKGGAGSSGAAGGAPGKPDPAGSGPISGFAPSQESSAGTPPQGVSGNFMTASQHIDNVIQGGMFMQNLGQNVMSTPLGGVLLMPFVAQPLMFMAP